MLTTLELNSNGTTDTFQTTQSPQKTQTLILDA